MKVQKTIIVILVTAVVTGSIMYFFFEKQKASLPVIDRKNNSLIHSSKEYALMARESWSAFECSSWASIADDQTEAERLFIYGYEKGKKFISALIDEKITEEDISEIVPIGFSWSLGGPSEDFMLGKVYSNAQDNALEDIFNTDGEYNSEDMQIIIAENKFRDGNCSLLGKY